MIGANMKYGVISEVKPGFAKVFLEEDDIVTDWWPVLQRTSLKDKESWPLNVQEHVVCLCDERCEDGVILGAIHNEEDEPDSGAGAGKFRKVFEDGTVIEYNKLSHKLTATVNGDVKVDADGNVDLTSTANVTLEAAGNVSVQAQTVDVEAAVSVEVSAPEVNITSPVVNITGALNVIGVATVGALAVSGSAGSGGVTIQGDLNITGDVAASGKVEGGEIKEGLIRLGTHKHSGVTTGPGTSGTPVP